MEAETRFPAMGSTVHVIVVGGSLRLLDVAREVIEALESRWSRFRATSEVSRLNDAGGRSLLVSGETVGLVTRALEGARVTGGLYDPTVLGDVMRAGYDRSFELLQPDAGRGSSSFRSGYGAIEVDEPRSTVRLPAGVGFDPGGIGKGYAADILATQILSDGAAGVCANIGGDVRVAGDAPDGSSWPVAIEHPFDPGRMEVVAIRDGAVATSTRTRRAWGGTGDRRHHLIDPASGRPVWNGVASTTAIAAEAWQAEVMAKAAFVAGIAEGLHLLAATGTDGLLIDDEGAVYPSAGFERFLAEAPPAIAV